VEPIEGGAPPREKGPRARRGWLSWADPRTAVLATLVTAAVVGGGRRWLKAVNARKAAARLEEPDVDPKEIEAAAGHGREGLLALFRLLEGGKDTARRHAAGRALARLWAADELIAEEEKAVVTRGLDVRWLARRRYPARLDRPIPIGVDLDLAFLDGAGALLIRPDQLEWSWRVVGARRASVETYSEWAPGPCRARFAIEPTDFPGPGPHTLVLQARVRTGEGLTSRWEHPLPHVRFSFELDPRLEVGAILTLPDAGREAVFAGAVRLETTPGEGGDGPRFLAIGSSLLMRDPPRLAITGVLPCDLAHAAALEFEGIDGAVPLGPVIVKADAGSTIVALEVCGEVDASARPGSTRARVILTADPALGWADPEVRSVWPGTIATAWAAVELVRR
jgi:hypothetical protein